MNLSYQKSAYDTLSQISKSDNHNVILCGNPGCGKTYMAHEYAKMLGISDFVVISPSVQNLRDMISDVLQTKYDVAVCIENLDCGVAASSYTILKFLEERRSNVYVIVTARNIRNVLDTIQSRCIIVQMQNPSHSDILSYASHKYRNKFESMKDRDIMKCISSMSDIDDIFKLSEDEISYIESLREINFLSNKLSVKSIAWKLSHFPNNSECDISLVMRYLMMWYKSNLKLMHAWIQCIDDLNLGIIGKQAVLYKFCMDGKYYLRSF